MDSNFFDVDCVCVGACVRVCHIVLGRGILELDFQQRSVGWAGFGAIACLEVFFVHMVNAPLYLCVLGGGCCCTLARQGCLLVSRLELYCQATCGLVMQATRASQAQPGCGT